MSHFLCISFTKINHLKTRPPYLGAISIKFYQWSKMKIMRLLSQHVSRNHICGQHMEVTHLNINMWIQQLEGGDAQEHNDFIQFLTSWWKLWNNIQYEQRWYDLCCRWHVHYLKINWWFDWQHLWKIRTTIYWNQLYCHQRLLNPKMKSSMK